MQAFRPATFLKRTPIRVFRVNIVNFLKNNFFIENLWYGCFWRFYHSKVKSARVFLIWFRAFTCFRSWLKTYAKFCTNNSLLSRDNNFFLAWIFLSSAFDFRICFGETLSCFQFWGKIYTKRCTNDNVIYRAKRLSSPALCTWSISGHDLAMEKMLRKQKYWIKNMAVKIPFWFWLLCTLLIFSCLNCSCKLL